MLDAPRKTGALLRPPPYDPDTDDHVAMLRAARALADHARREAVQALQAARAAPHRDDAAERV